MDLREKPGKVQKFLELMLRFRLIALVVLVVATVAGVARNWDVLVTYPLAFSETLGMQLAYVDSVQYLWKTSQQLVVAGIACVVMLFVFGGIRAGIASIVSAATALIAFYLLGGSESLVLPIIGAVTFVALVMILFVKWSVACGLFPFLLSGAFFTVIQNFLVALATGEPVELWWGIMSVWGFACCMAFSVVVGKHLGAGVPHTGALVKAARQFLVPVIVGNLLVVVATGMSRESLLCTESLENAGNLCPGFERGWWIYAVWFVIQTVWFYAFAFPVSSFAPWERLRAGSRRIEMKDKKKKSKAKK